MPPNDRGAWLRGRLSEAGDRLNTNQAALTQSAAILPMRYTMDGKPRLTEHWYATVDGDPAGLLLYERHYSCYQYKDNRQRKLFMGPGEKLVLLTYDADALFGWRKFKDDSGQRGVNCAVFRNEGTILSSELIIEAERPAWARWPGERLYTYVSPNVRSSNPGCCFKKAGWIFCGLTGNGLLIFEKVTKS